VGDSVGISVVSVGKESEAPVSLPVGSDVVPVANMYAGTHVSNNMHTKTPQISLIFIR
jgi:hypothetical protein